MSSAGVGCLRASLAMAMACLACIALGGDPAREAALAAALRSARMTLLDGVRQAGSAGTPISGKFEIEDRKLLLSVYTAGKGLAVAAAGNEGHVDGR